MPDIKATENIFNKIVYSRKTEAYRKAINIAKMILLNYHPDVQGGSHSVLALMFNMNILWEKFVYISLKKCLPKYLQNCKVIGQIPQVFWCPVNGKAKTIIPDIVIENNDNTIVLDTKWKDLENDKKLSDNDLKQAFVYGVYFKSQETILVYPGESKDIRGTFKNFLKEKVISGGLIFIPVNEKIKDWQKEIAEQIFNIYIKKAELF
jgi:5-methylcytosine-specific restriction enzyme subunit McrC